MTKLILPKETIRPNGVFFSQMLEALSVFGIEKVQYC
jgi:hypothetical protein